MDISSFLRQLAFQSPFLLSCSIGLILSLILIPRSAKPALFAAAACALLILGTLTAHISHALLLNSFITGTITSETYNILSIVIQLFSSFALATGIALLVIATFIGRSAPPRASFPVIPHNP